MLRSLISFAATFVTLGGGIVLTITLVKALQAPVLVIPGVVAIITATMFAGLLTAPGRTFAERWAWVSKNLAG